MAKMGVDKSVFMMSGYRNRRCWKHCHRCKKNFRDIKTTYVYPEISIEDNKLVYSCEKCIEEAPND